MTKKDLPSHNQNAGSRGNRLYPSRTSRLYSSLTLMRREVEQIIANHLPANGKDLLAIDFGCGNMPYRPLFEKVGVRYVGADFPGNTLADIAVAADGRIDRPSDSCDIVVSTQVLEHVESPASYLQECYRVLRCGGRLLLSTHGYWWYHPDPVD
jgi:SAM-dependent methyltransferase